MKVPPMQPIEKLREYTNTVCSQIRWKKAHDAVSDEIQNHLLDQRDAYMQEGVAEHEATEQAIADMGDPVDVGTQLDRVHRPKPQWGLLLLTLGIVLLGVLALTLVQDDLGKHYQGLFLAGIQMKFVLMGTVTLLAIYFADFTLIGKYPKIIYFGLLALFTLLFIWEVQNNTTPSALNKYYFFRAYCPLLFPTAYSGIIYAVRGKGIPGILICIAACFLPAFLAWQGPSHYPTFSGTVLIMASGAVMLGIAITKNWFGVKRTQSWLWAYLPFAGATVLFISKYLRTSHDLERIIVFLHPERDPEAGGYTALVIKDLLENAKLVGTGTIPPRYSASPGFPLPVIHTDYLMTYIIYRMGWLAFGLIIALFLAFVFVGIWQCLKQRSILGQLVSVSVLITFTFQTVHYIGYNLGFIMMGPMSLPLISYGGVAMVVNLGLIGLMLSVFRSGNAVRDGRLSASSRQRIISWREHRLVIGFGRKNGD
ncbi:cell wall shape-determining protein [compost metagenome]